MQQQLFSDGASTPVQADFFNDDEQPDVTANVREGGVLVTFREALSADEQAAMRRILRGVAGVGEVEVWTNKRQYFCKWYSKTTKDVQIGRRLANLHHALRDAAQAALNDWRTHRQEPLF